MPRSVESDRRPVQPAEFVAVRVAQVGQVKLAHGTIAKARRVFTCGAAVGYTRRMPRVYLLGGLRLEANGAAVAMACRLAIDGCGDAEGAVLAAVEIPVLVGGAGCYAQGAEHRVVKLL